MTYSHLTTAELTTIANFFTQGTKAYKVAQMLKRSVETIYRAEDRGNDCRLPTTVRKQ